MTWIILARAQCLTRAVEELIGTVVAGVPGVVVPVMGAAVVVGEIIKLRFPIEIN